MKTLAAFFFFFFKRTRKGICQCLSRKNVRIIRFQVTKTAKLYKENIRKKTIWTRVFGWMKAQRKTGSGKSLKKGPRRTSFSPSMTWEGPRCMESRGNNSTRLMGMRAHACLSIAVYLLNGERFGFVAGREVAGLWLYSAPVNLRSWYKSKRFTKNLFHCLFISILVLWLDTEQSARRKKGVEKHFSNPMAIFF